MIWIWVVDWMKFTQKNIGEKKNKTKQKHLYYFHWGRIKSLKSLLNIDPAGGDVQKPHRGELPI